MCKKNQTKPNEKKIQNTLTLVIFPPYYKYYLFVYTYIRAKKY